MTETIHVSVAWPYANGDMHVGHLAGAYLPADIFARYHRLKGNRVLMVSGSDSHGTPITIEADKRGITPRELFEHYHHRFLETQKQIGICTRTNTCTRRFKSSCIPKRRDAFFPIVMSKAHVQSAVTKKRVEISVTTAATCSTPLS